MQNQQRHWSISDGSEVIILSEHWLWPFNLDHLQDIHPDYAGFRFADKCNLNSQEVVVGWASYGKMKLKSSDHPCDQDRLRYILRHSTSARESWWKCGYHWSLPAKLSSFNRRFCGMSGWSRKCHQFTSAHRPNYSGRRFQCPPNAVKPVLRSWKFTAQLHSPP